MWEPKTNNTNYDVVDQALQIYDDDERIWIGITNTLAGQGIPKYGSDDTNVVYTNWEKGQPNSGNCAHAKTFPGRHYGTWSDGPCSVTYVFICEF